MNAKNPIFNPNQTFPLLSASYDVTIKYLTLSLKYKWVPSNLAPRSYANLFWSLDSFTLHDKVKSKIASLIYHEPFTTCNINRCAN